MKSGENLHIRLHPEDFGNSSRVVVGKFPNAAKLRRGVGFVLELALDFGNFSYTEL